VETSDPIALNRTTDRTAGLPNAVNGSYVAAHLEPLVAAFGRVLPQVLLQTSHCADITRVQHPLAQVDPKLSSASVSYEEAKLIPVSPAG